MSSGFQAAVSTRKRSLLANPSILGTGRRKNAELVRQVCMFSRSECQPRGLWTADEDESNATYHAYRVVSVFICGLNMGLL